jgi:hypothetical protein
MNINEYLINLGFIDITTKDPIHSFEIINVYTNKFVFDSDVIKIVILVGNEYGFTHIKGTCFYKSGLENFSFCSLDNIAHQYLKSILSAIYQKIRLPINLNNF